MPERREIRAGVHGCYAEEQLNIRNVGRRIALHEGHDIVGHAGRKARTEEMRARQLWHDPVDPHRSMQRALVFAQAINAGRDVILQVLADAFERSGHCNTMRLQLRRVADTRQHEKLRRVDRAAGKDHFALGAQIDDRAVAPIPNADGAACFEQYLRGQCPRFDPQIWPCQCRPEVGCCRAAPATMADGRLTPAEPFLLAAVVVGGSRIAGANTGLEKRIEQRVGKVRVTDPKGAGISAINVAAASPRFLPSEIGQDMRVRPFAQAMIRPPIIVAAVPPHIGHGVDR